MNNIGSVNMSYDTYFTKENTEDTVNNGTYAMIESSVSKEMRTVDEENELFAKLGELLANYGLPHRQVEGCYQGEQSNYSFFVIKSGTMDLAEFRKIIFDLGVQFKQESIVLSTKKFVEVVYTKGKHFGKAQRGEGFSSDSNIDDKNYTRLFTSDNEYYYIGAFEAYKNAYEAWSV